MHILITGAGGMIGAKLLAAFARGEGPLMIGKLTLADIKPPPVPDGFTCDIKPVACDITSPADIAPLIADHPDLIIHLAAVVSGEAEADFEKGYRVNMDGTRNLLEAIRLEGANSPYCPRIIFTSSVATFGGPYPESIPDDFINSPQNSYGVQKVIGEMLLSDYTRRGFIDGIGIRVPTICIRHGKPKVREHSVKKVPVSTEVRHWFASPRAAAGYLAHACVMDSSQIGNRRILNMPGVSATVGEQIEALRRHGGDAAVKLIRHQPDPAIQQVIAGWPERFDASRALALGFTAEQSFDDIIRVFLDEDIEK